VTSFGSDGIEFVEEEDAGSCCFGTVEEISDGFLGCTNVFVEDFWAFD
jgi:hypothetical protein